MDIMEALQRCAPWCSMDPEAWNFVLVYMDEQNAKITELEETMLHMQSRLEYLELGDL